MYKFVALFALVACSLAAPAPEPGFLATGGAYHAAPLVAAAPVAVAHNVPVATSYANTYKVDHKSAIVGSPLAYAAPVAPVAIGHAAPAYYSAHAAPAYYSAHPAALTYAAHPAPVAYLH